MQTSSRSRLQTREWTEPTSRARTTTSRRCFRRRVPNEPRARNGLRRLAPGLAVIQAADPGEADDVGSSAGPLLDRTTAP
jgi:hypothetical protein